MMIGIIGPKGEDHCTRVASLLEKRGTEPLLIDTLGFPEKVHFSLRNREPFYEGKSISSISAFYLRRFLLMPVEESEDDAVLTVRQRRIEAATLAEISSLFSSWLKVEQDSGKPLINPLTDPDIHSIKGYQLCLARGLGLSVPETLLTNDPQAVKDFTTEVGEIIYKPLTGGASTQPLMSKDLTPDRLSLLKNAPVLFQKRIYGQDVRVFVIEDRIVSSCVIHSQTLDFRDSKVRLERFSLPSSVTAQCRAIARALNLRFTAIDFKRTPEGEYFFFEANTSPMFTVYSRLSGDPVDEALADYLVKCAREYESRR